MRRLFLTAPLVLAACIGGPQLVPLGTNAGGSRTDAVYAREFVGRYSPSPICAGQELQVELAPESAYVGETGCNIAATDRIENGVALTLVNCRAEGTPAPDRVMRVLRAGSGALRIETPTTSATVQPCFD
ncbi:hypothetical protein [Roseisalinus antarcticus]|uniref:Lipoprotein n=1 Tax=Roseisalinus antarcticus TaxID=254357 RepID=A0A1Y5SCL5_9RHOB|nr:hypothetical protein [Roseisalinus antarcticus]SLN37715.1 hypothetical protein ROA7023_01424 [Roseisalinus antarcticus]